MRRGSDIALDAMKKELVRLQKIAEKAKNESEQYLNSSTEVIAIHNEFIEIVNSKQYGQDVINKLDNLKKRRDKVDKIRSKDFIKLLDKENESRFEVENLQHEIFMAEFRNKRHK